MSVSATRIVMLWQTEPKTPWWVCGGGQEG
jgi:hypothetical protein